MSSLTREVIIAQGYLDGRQLPSGIWIAVADSIYTRDLCWGLDEVGWSKKWMYEDRTAADRDFYSWDGETEDPPGPWIKQKPEDRWNPNIEREGE